MKAEIITIGNELLNGNTVNQNAAFIAAQLFKYDLPVHWISVAGDDIDEMVNAMKHAAQRADLVVTTGGLGPTLDDKTRNAVASLLNVSMRFDENIMLNIEEKFKSRNMEMAESNRIQAEIPEGTFPLNNARGCAPGLRFEYQKTPFFVLPGVPREMQAMLVDEVIPVMKDAGHSNYVQELKTTGISESMLYQKLESIVASAEDSGFDIAFLPSLSGTVIRFCGDSERKAEIQKFVRQIKAAVGEWIYGKENDTLASVVGSLLKKSRKTIAVAESCTGGLVSHELTNVPGSSDYFKQAFVTYSNDAKMKLLDVPQLTLMAHGAVSPETAQIMALRIRKYADTDIGLSITGIAGPGGGSKAKPVGLVYIGYSDRKQTFSMKFKYFDDRLMNKEMFTTAALDVLRRALSGKTQNSL